MLIEVCLVSKPPEATANMLLNMLFVMTMTSLLCCFPSGKMKGVSYS